jgi:putative transposase
MASLPRNVAPGLPLHVIEHGNNRQMVVFAEGTYWQYLDSLRQTPERHDCAVHA